MTPKEQAAMQQALEALEIYGEHAKDCPQYPTYTRPQDYPKCDCGYEQAIIALREALAEPDIEEMTLTQIAARHKQAEGSIVKTCPDGYGTITTEQAEQEPVGYFTYDGDYNIWEEVFSKDTYGAKPLYAAPVRTKELTELLDVMVGMANYIDKLGGDSKGFRAVITADREKNK